MLTKGPHSSWFRSRYGFVLFCIASLLAGWLGVRVVLFFAFGPSPAPLADSFFGFLTGLHRDLYAALWLTLPVLIWFAFMSDWRVQAKWHRVLFWTVCGICAFVTIFIFFVEYFFFDEFKSRFNTVAVDYLIYPTEVFINIWESYHVGIVIFICLLLAAGWLVAARKLFPHTWERPFSARARLVHVLAALALLLVLTPTIRLKGAHVSPDRTLNEIANNGDLSFIAAAWTHHLDYSAFYKTMDRAEAYQRVRRLLTEPNSRYTQEADSIQRFFSGDTNRPRLNVVIFLEESLGSEFWGSLGRKEPTLTPEMDRLAAQEGMLFTNIYACGNRTVRGMEGVLSSFPPLPGDSIVKRDLSDHVETIARVLKRDGYATLFLYGGRGVFDSMRSYAVRNGYERFIEQKHFSNPTFKTIWGVCDEDLFARTIVECRELARTAQPFLATVLSVSNHKPYTYPKGRIAEDPDQKKRENAVKYSDYSLGQFFKAARQETFWTNTIFVVVADHGARVYGKQSIPIHSYEIPVLIAGPAVVSHPVRVGQLGSSLDVSPTVLGLIGRPYQSLFFGHDLLNCRPETGRALLNHNRDIGMLARERLVVLGLMKTDEFYEGDPKRAEVTLMKQPSASERELEADTIAIYQVADELYTHQRYFVKEEGRSEARRKNAE